MHRITNLSFFLQGTRLICWDCLRTCGPLHHNRECTQTCFLCLRSGRNFPCRMEEGKVPIQCEDCRFCFPHWDCFKQHLTVPARSKTVSTSLYVWGVIES